MSQIVVVVGGSGAGKSFLLSKIQEINKEFNSNPDENHPLNDYPYTVIKKYTTRSPRKNENKVAIDLHFNATDEELERCGDFVYLYGENSYGIDCNDIDEALKNGRSPIIIVRDFKTVNLLKQRYGQIIDIYCKCGLSKGDLKARLLQEGSLQDEVQVRIKNIKHDENQWLYSESDFYDYIVNRYDSSFIKAFISSLKKAPKKNYKKIVIIAMDESDRNNIKSALDLEKYEVECINPEDIVFNDNYREKKDYQDFKEKLIKKIEESRLIILDISIRASGETDISHGAYNNDTHGLYRLANIVLRNKNNDVLIVSDKRLTQPIPFDIISSHICFYDGKNGTAIETIQKQVEGILL